MNFSSQILSINKPSINRLLGISWFLLSIFFSNLNDLIGKILGKDTHFFQITFLRFFISFLILLIVLIQTKKIKIRTEYTNYHFLRGFLLVVATALWFYGLRFTLISTATIISFTIPIFTLVFGSWFLSEHLSLFKVSSTAIGFLGVIIALEITSVNANFSSLVLVFATIFYSLLGIINKKLIGHIDQFNMLFHSAFWGVLLSAIPAYLFWTSINLKQILLLVLLGAGANLILYCLLQSYKYEEITFLAPFQYVEIVFSIFFGLLIFNETPGLSSMIGGSIIVASTLLLFPVKLSKNKVKLH